MFNQSTIKELQYFVGKVCTIFVNKQLIKNFNNTEFNDYFVGIIESINNDGIFTIHPATKCKNFYLFSSISTICEEQMLNPESPEEAKLICELKEKGIKSDIEFNPYEDLEEINKIIKKKL